MGTVKYKKFLLDTSNWGDTSYKDVAKVLNSVIDEFENIIDKKFLNPKVLVIKNTRTSLTKYDGPIFFSNELNNLIYLQAIDKLWSQYAYQFSHEYCHHIIESDFINKCNRFGWFEETLCELASINIIRQMSKTWRSKPPYSNWKEYSKDLWNYADTIIQNVDNKIETPLKTWIGLKIDELYADRYNRRYNCLIATNLLDIFNENPKLWNFIGLIKNIPVNDSMTFKQFLSDWKSLVQKEQLALFEILEVKFV